MGAHTLKVALACVTPCQVGKIEHSKAEITRLKPRVLHARKRHARTTQIAAFQMRMRPLRMIERGPAQIDVLKLRESPLAM